MVNLLAWQSQTFSIFIIAFLLPFNLKCIFENRSIFIKNNFYSKFKSLQEVDTILLVTIILGLILSFAFNASFFFITLILYITSSGYLLLPQNCNKFKTLTQSEFTFLCFSFFVLLLSQTIFFFTFGYPSEAYATEPGNHDLQYYFDGIFQSKNHSGIQILNNEYLQSFSTSNRFYWGEGVNRSGIFDLGSFQFSFLKHFTPNAIYSISLWGIVFALYALRNIDYFKEAKSLSQKILLIFSPMFITSIFNSDLASAIAGGIFLYFVSLLVSSNVQDLKWKLMLCFLVSGLIYPELLFYEFVFLFVYKFKEIWVIVKKKFSFISIFSLLLIFSVLTLISWTTFFEIWNVQKTPDYNYFFTNKPYFWVFSLLANHNLNLNLNYTYLQVAFSSILLLLYSLNFKKDLINRALLTILCIYFASYSLIFFTKTFYIEHKMLELLGPSAWFLFIYNLSLQKEKIDFRKEFLSTRFLNFRSKWISFCIVHVLFALTAAGIVVQINNSNTNSQIDKDYFSTLSKIPDRFRYIAIEDSKLVMPKDFQQINFALTSLAHRDIKFCFLSKTGSELQGGYFNNLIQTCNEMNKSGHILVFHPKILGDLTFTPPTLLPVRGILPD